jgi:prepilin-type N-terminal cleavage/methylation domain-containing protein
VKMISYDRLSVRRGAFTLVEMLVVIGIIAILASLSVAGLRIAQNMSIASAEQHDITLLRSAVDRFEREMGDYPPTQWVFFQVVGVNNRNEGNECLFACLQSRKKGGPYVEDLDESRWTNTDSDTLVEAMLRRVVAALEWTRSGPALLEYTDHWGNPYVYFHHRDYGKKLSYVRADGVAFDAEAAKSESDPKSWAAPSTYQIWSLGPDGENQNGGGDDICSWRS